MKTLTITEVKQVFPSAIERTYSAGQIIFYHGDSPNQVMFIKRGAVKFYDTDIDGNEKIMHIGGEGSIFPLFYSFEDKDTIDAFYATIIDTEVLVVPLTEFQNMLKTSADFAFRILQWYAGEMDHVVLRLKSLEKSSAKEKVLQALYYLCGEHSSRSKLRVGWYRLNFPLTQQTLADLTGLTRETVNVVLNDPELASYIRSRRQLFDINRSKLKEILQP